MTELINSLHVLRAELHRFPELSFKEERTADIIQSFITERITGSNLFTIHRPFLTSVVVEYSNGGDLPYRLFRADMDALPVKECKSNEIISQNQGVMHACGHDVHMTILCGLIAETARLKPQKNVLFVFQPGEEGAGGAKGLIDSGFFERFNIERAFALHVTDDHEVGEVASNGGLLFAIPREIDVVFKGKSAHAAYPEKGNNALMASARFLFKCGENLKNVIAENEVFLAHFGKISSGTARNIISDYAEIQGTLRSFDMDVMIKGTETVKKTADESAAFFGCSAEVKILGEYVAVKNDTKLFDLLKKISLEKGIRCIDKKGELVGEDFGYFTQKWGGLLFWLGSKESGTDPNPLHSEKFFPSFKAIDTGLKIMREILLY
ncbi:MAG TPA: M20 family metallopeptidase [bacterium]|nr:M20 family metallopeptidase [bacterium]